MQKIKPQFKITSIYIVVSVAWIYFSDTILKLITENPEQITWLQTIKGWFFVIATGTLLYYLIKQNFNDIEKSQNKLRESYDSTINSLVRILDIRHNETKSHTDRVTTIATRMAEMLGINGQELENIHYGAILHDIGKIAIPDKILTKTGKLTHEEFEQIQSHTTIAMEFIKPIPFLRGATNIPYLHHERWDGNGYPLGLKGKEIPIAARIFAIADVWDALRSERSYKKAWSETKAIKYMQDEAGKHFDPELTTLFLKNLKELTKDLDYNHT